MLIKIFNHSSEYKFAKDEEFIEGTKSECNWKQPNEVIKEENTNVMGL